MSNQPRKNVELKARLASINDARLIASRWATDRLPDQHQLDTYFRCASGRFKVREIDHRHAELIQYARPDTTTSKTSHYRIVAIDQPEQLKVMLDAALGTLVVVEKHRQIWLHQNVRMHLDRVVGLGEFLEFEAVLAGDQDVQEGHAIVSRLQTEFGLRAEDLVTGSYSDLMLKGAAIANHCD